MQNLDPTRLILTDIADLSGGHQLRMNFGHPDSPQGHMLFRFKFAKKQLPFPRDTIGFFYFRYDPGKHVAVGDIRFRVINPDKTLDIQRQFEQGHDLVVRPGHLWQIHLLDICRTTSNAPLRSMLRSQGLPQHVEDAIATIHTGIIEKSRPRRTLLESPTDPFVVDLSKQALRISVLDQRGTCTKHSLMMRHDNRRSSGIASVFTNLSFC